jgi:hypothetical protein
MDGRTDRYALYAFMHIVRKEQLVMIFKHLIRIIKKIDRLHYKVYFVNDFSENNRCLY